MTHTPHMGQSTNVLCIDGAAVYCESFKESIEPLGYLVDIALTGNEGFNLFNKNNYDAVAFDGHPTDIEGMDFARQILAVNSNIPLLLVVTYGYEQLITSALRLGNINYIIKDENNHYLKLIPGVFANLMDRAHQQRETNQVISELDEDDCIPLDAFENVSAASIIIDENGIVTSINAPAREMFKYSTDEIVGQNVKLLMPDDHARKHDTYLKNYTESRESKIIGFGREVMGLRKNGDVFPMILGIGEISTKKRKLYIGTMHDLTSRKNIEEQLRQSQRVETLGQLTAGIAHDFNNLLAIMLGNIEMLDRLVTFTDKERTHFKEVIFAMDRASSLTDRLLAYSYKQSLSPIAVNIESVLENFVEILRRTLGEEIELHINAHPTLWLILIDLHQFENAILNLAINARDAMPNGGILKFDLSNIILNKSYSMTNDQVKPGEYVRITIDDTGSGMTEEVLKKVLDPFFTTKTAGAGSGLGLSMVDGFVKQSKGYIKLHSEVNVGTTVNLYIPRSKETINETTTEDVIQEFQLGTGNVLIVEDELNLRKITVSIFNDHGYQTFEAGNGKDALKFLNGDIVFDLLYTDIVLPGGMNGVEIAENAKQIQPDIKALYTTGYVDKAITHQGKLVLGKTLIKKPYLRAELLKMVKNILTSK